LNEAAFEADVSIALTAELESRLPDRRAAVMLESAESIAAEIQWHTEALQQSYGVICALGETTGATFKKAQMTLPALPGGRPITLDITSKDAAGAVSAWEAARTALEANPLATITVPGNQADVDTADTTPVGLSWSTIRAAWRGFRE
jgi:hypothetical protein